MVNNKEKISLIITAGGSSSRYGKNKLLEEIYQKPVILHTLDAFKNISVNETVITVSQELKNQLEKILPQNTKIKLIDGGKTRQQSVYNGLKALNKGTELVIIHDGARPLIRQEVIEKCLQKARETKAAIVAVKAVDTIKIVDDEGKILSTPNREALRCVQTPQIFDFKLIVDAHKKLEGMNFSDDAGLLEYLETPVYVVDGDYTNIKITTPSDKALLEQILNLKTSG